MIRTIFRAPSARLAFVVGAVLVAASCKETTGNLPKKVSTVLVTPDSFQVIVLRSYQLVVTPMTSGGEVIDGKIPTFQSSDATIANVSSTGLVVGIKPGAATITATVDGVKGIGKVVVVREPVARISIEPPGGQVLFQGQTFALNAKVFDANNNQLSGRAITWGSTNPGVATVVATTAEDARITAVAPGQTTITASSEGQNATVVITVTFRAATVKITPTGAQVLRVGGSLQLTATAFDTQNNPVQGLTPTWTSSFPQVATVDQNTGKVTAIQPGSTSISVQMDNITQSIPVTVTLVPLKSITLSPANSFDLFETASKQLTVTLIDSTGAVASQIGRSLLYQTADLTVAVINASGVVTGIAPGSSVLTVNAQTNGVNDLVSSSTTANIKHINTAAVVIPPAINLTVGNPVQVTAQVQDSLGRPLANRPVTWVSSDTTIFTVQSQGTVAAVLTPIKAGSATLTASNEGKTSIASPVTVK